MTLARLIRAAKAQNADKVFVWVNSNLGLIPAGRWYLNGRTLTAPTGPQSTPLQFGKFAKASHWQKGLDWSDLTFRVLTHRNPLACLATASTRPTPGVYVPDATDNRHAGRMRQVRVTWSPMAGSSVNH